MSRVGVAWLALSLGGALACGGRYERNVPLTDAEGQAGSGGKAGGMALAGGAGGPTDVCVEQFTAYSEYREQVVAEFASFGCMIDSDCVSFYDQSGCDTACVLLTTGARRGVIDRLNNYEVGHCDSRCSELPWTSCPPAVQPLCVAGRCQQRQQP